MKRLKHLALEFSDKVVKGTILENETFKQKVQAVILLSFEEGFKEAFHFAKALIEEDKKSLEPYATMGERRAAMVKVQERLTDAIKEMTE